MLAAMDGDTWLYHLVVARGLVLLLGLGLVSDAVCLLMGRTHAWQQISMPGIRLDRCLVGLA